MDDLGSLVDNMALQNSVRKILLPEFKYQRGALKRQLPAQGNAVIFRKCRCGRVYVKPLGCDTDTHTFQTC